MKLERRYVEKPWGRTELPPMFDAPAGKRIGEVWFTGAPAKPGVWRVTVRGIGSVSGTDVDPAGVTNGYAAPGTVTGTVSFLNSGGYTTSFRLAW